jgi:hypothetical protein
MFRTKPLEHTARSPSLALAQQLNVLVVSWACSRYGLGQRVAAYLKFGPEDGQSGSNQLVVGLVPRNALVLIEPINSGMARQSVRRSWHRWWRYLPRLMAAMKA